MVKSLKDRDNLIRQIYLFIYKYNGCFDELVIRSVMEANNIGFSPMLTSRILFDNYIGGPPRDINDERLKLFVFKYYNKEISGLI